MSGDGEHILAHLDTVATERAARAAEPALAARVAAVKDWQHARFARSYADLQAQPRYAAATRFFLEELYGPRDYRNRDEQFARVVPALVRLFPTDTVHTVRTLAELHALSEVLDTALARQVQALPLTAAAYGQAWRATGRASERAQQIALIGQVGRALDAYTRNPLLRNGLRMMRVPARLAGLGELQGFLETGFDTFAAMHGASEFMATIDARERAEVAALFNPTPLEAGP